MIYTPIVISKALEDDRRSTPIFIGDKRILRTLLDSGSLVELISKRVTKEIYTITYTDTGKEISLIDNYITFLKRYIYLPVNIVGVRIRYIRYVVDYRKGRVTIRGSDGIPITLDIELAPIEYLEELPVIYIDKEGVDNIL
ncbi:hypothetical protein N7497_003244 [Penicillium chrysogenum]|nr:hypothetical protein N7497_003244 [Penicillium chrysogenum]